MFPWARARRRRGRGYWRLLRGAGPSRARRRAAGPPRPRPLPRFGPVASRARTLASSGDMQMRYRRGGGPGLGGGVRREGRLGAARSWSAPPTPPVPALATARAPTSRPVEPARTRARRPPSWRPSPSAAWRRSLAAFSTGPAPRARGPAGARLDGGGWRVRVESTTPEARVLIQPRPTRANCAFLEKPLPHSGPQSVCLFQGSTVAPAVPLISICAFPPLCDTQASRARSDDGDGGGSLLSGYYMPRNDPGIFISQSWIQTQDQGTP